VDIRRGPRGFSCRHMTLWMSSAISSRYVWLSSLSNWKFTIEKWAAKLARLKSVISSKCKKSRASHRTMDINTISDYCRWSNTCWCAALYLRGAILMPDTKVLRSRWLQFWVNVELLVQNIRVQHFGRAHGLSIHELLMSPVGLSKRFNTSFQATRWTDQ